MLKAQILCRKYACEGQSRPGPKTELRSVHRLVRTCVRVPRAASGSLDTEVLELSTGPKLCN
jgi:hypothetical protein